MPTTKFFRIAVAKDQAGDFNILLYPKYDSQGNVTVKRKFNVHWHVHNFTAAKIWVQLRDFSPKEVQLRDFSPKDPVDPVTQDLKTSVDGANPGNGNPGKATIKGKIKTDSDAEDGLYTYKVYVGSKVNDLNEVKDPELRIDGDALVPPRKKGKKK